MASQGPRYPTNAANMTNFGTETSWTSMTNSYTSNGQYATCPHAITNPAPGLYVWKNSAPLAMTNYGFSIPSGTTITNISVALEGYTGRITAGQSTMAVDVWLTYNGSLFASGSTTFTLSEQTKTISWSGLSVSYSTVNSSSFGVVVKVYGAQSTTLMTNYSSYIDTAAVTVTYTCKTIGTVANADVSDGTLDSYYLDVLRVTTTEAVTWSISSGSLPTGLSLSSVGNLAGTPSSAGEFTFTVRATSVCDPTTSVTKQFNMIIVCSSAYRFVTNNILDFTSGSVFTQTLEATQPYGWGVAGYTLIEGTWPTGVTLTYATGVIAGTPSAPGSTVVKLKVTWTNGCLATLQFPITYITAKTATDTIDGTTGVTDSGTVDTAGTSYEDAYNDMAYVLNTKTGTWTLIDNMPFSSAIYRADDNTMLGTRQDKGAIGKINYGSLFGADAITSWVQTGYMDFGDLDEIKEMPPQFSEALKRVRAFFCDVKSTGILTVTIYTEQNSTGLSFFIRPATTDDVVYNAVRTALSRDMRGKYFSLKITNDPTALTAAGETLFTENPNFWMGEMALKVLPRGLK
jgi:hypothetical protein